MPLPPDSASHTPQAERFVLCMKWGTKYGPEYVNRLYAMVQRHLPGDFRFVCLTDDAVGLHPSVEALPIPPLNLPPGIPERGWAKLTTFSQDLHGLRGRALFLDIDIVIVDDITPFFERDGEFLIIHDHKRPWRITGNSSVYRFELGQDSALLENFRRDHANIRARFRNEQAYLSDWMQRQGKLQYWPKSWCASFKYHCIPRWPLNYWQAPRIPAGCKIVIFHGKINPPDALVGSSNGDWRHIKPSPWIAEHWRE